MIQKSGEPINKQQILDRIVTDDADINLEAIEVLVHRLRKNWRKPAYRSPPCGAWATAWRTLLTTSFPEKPRFPGKTAIAP